MGTRIGSRAQLDRGTGAPTDGGSRRAQVRRFTRDTWFTYSRAVEDEVFRALADPQRRLLLDRLVEQDGQTLGELEACLPALSRFAVMNHLRVLEHAQLLTSQKAGRYKYHYLNPVPIQLVADRWISKYAAPFTKAISHLKTTLEGSRHGRSSQTLSRLHGDHSRYPGGDLARTHRGGHDSRDYFGGAVVSSWQVGDPFSYTYPDGTVLSMER